MPLFSLLYISRSTVSAEGAERVVGDIVGKAVVRNQTLGLTGALLFTGTNFAQVLEGEQDAVNALMAKVARDPRHCDVTIIDQSAAPERRFVGWSMAYSGPSQFVTRHVTRLLKDPGPAQQRRAAAWLTDLLSEFTTMHKPA